MCGASGFMGGEGVTLKSLRSVSLHIMHFAFTASPGGSKVQVKERHENHISRCALQLPNQTLSRGHIRILTHLERWM